MRIPMRRMLTLAAVTAVVLLSACATTRVVDNEVQTFSRLPAVPVPATYRFERLPSQQSVPAEQARLEAAAEPALAKAGLVRHDGGARYSVLIGSSVQTTVQRVDPWFYGSFGAYGPYGPHRRWRGYPGFYGAGWGPGWGYRYDMWDNGYAEREVSVVIRELASQQVVYETRAVHDTRWPNDPALLAPMFDAALSSFPQPPAGVRRVNIVLPPKP
jgi:hypothetical protein